MKFARIVILVVAIVAGGLAALLVGRPSETPPPVIVQETSTSEVLVASSDIQMGQVVSAGSLTWRSWPQDGTASFITRSSQPNAIEEISGSIARQPIVGGEPIRMQKIVKADGSGFMAAILPAGMRAVATEISAETGAGGFILPNDRVDVVLTRREENQAGQSSERFSTTTVLTNVRILAIDQTAGEKDGEKTVIGRTATLELSPRQAEILALARQLGTISLSLRALVDANPSGLAGAVAEESDDGRTSGMTVIRYGIESKVN